MDGEQREKNLKTEATVRVRVCLLPDGGFEIEGPDAPTVAAAISALPARDLRAHAPLSFSDFDLSDDQVRAIREAVPAIGRELLFALASEDPERPPTSARLSDIVGIAPRSIGRQLALLYEGVVGALGAGSVTKPRVKTVRGARVVCLDRRIYLVARRVVALDSRERILLATKEQNDE